MVFKTQKATSAKIGANATPRHWFYNKPSFEMAEVAAAAVALTITSPPYWNAVDYDVHAQDTAAWHRVRQYDSFGETYADYLNNIAAVFSEVLRVTAPGGFCAIVIGTILHNKKHYSAPMAVTERMQSIGWEFHQDIIWNKVTGGVRRAGGYIKKPYAGYYYPNIMTEYVLIFRKKGAIRRDNKEALPVDTVFTRDIANNVWHIAPVPPKSIAHPCPFPAELVRRLLLLYSHENDLILDPFLGSGQTALVALKHNRRCVGYETERSYIELAHARIQNPPSERKHNLIPEYKKVETN